MSLEDELHQIDLEIKKLKIQFDLFFVGSLPKPPTEQREALERLVKKCQGTSTKSLATRFLCNSLVNKFNAFQELWSKGMKTKEEGVRLHPLAARAAHQSAETETGGSSGPPQPVAAMNHAGGEAGNPERRSRQPGLIAAARFSTTRRDDAGLRGLYENYVAAKNLAGDTKLPSFDTFARELTRHAAQLKAKADCEAIEVEVYSNDNKVKLRARPAR